MKDLSNAPHLLKGRSENFKRCSCFSLDDALDALGCLPHISGEPWLSILKLGKFVKILICFCLLLSYLYSNKCVCVWGGGVDSHVVVLSRYVLLCATSDNVLIVHIMEHQFPLPPL
jgi:hypothetical protein